jgi:uncharacterized membrane protein
MLVLLIVLLLALTSHAYVLPMSKMSQKLSKSPRISTLHASIVPGIGDAGCALPSPSGINTQPVPVQAAVFVGVSLGIYLATILSIGAFDILEQTFPGPIKAWEGTWGLIGLIYGLAGVSHFTIKKDFMNIMPAPGAWGFWYVPGSKEFHVLWTGIVEFVAGMWLAVGTASSYAGFSLLPAVWTSPSSDAATVLLALTVLVTPANIYMVETLCVLYISL